MVEWSAGRAVTDRGARFEVRRVDVTEPLILERRYDYADAFELAGEAGDPLAPEDWIRAGVDRVPGWIKRIAGNPEGLGSARIIESSAVFAMLEDSDALMDTVMIGRNIGPGRRTLTTALRYRKPLLARVIWSIIGPLHRRTAQRVVSGGLD